MKTAIVTYGRFNPVTKGHMKMFTKMHSLKVKEGGELYVFPSRQEKNSTNPLSFHDKKGLLKRVLPGFIIFDSIKVRTPYDAMKYLSNKGYKKVIFVVGEDRVYMAKNIEMYINHPDPEKSFLFEEYAVVNAGKRKPESNGIIGISGSKVRQFAFDNEYEKFRKDFVDMPDEFVKQYFKKIKTAMAKE